MTFEFSLVPAPREETTFIMLGLEVYLGNSRYLSLVKCHANWFLGNFLAPNLNKTDQSFVAKRVTIGSESESSPFLFQLGSKNSGSDPPRTALPEES
jgi:hypothetical protein